MGSPVAAPLAHRVVPNADSSQIAEAVVATWREIDAVLAPIIGKRGLAALYRRSIHVTAQDHPWLNVSHEKALSISDFTELIPLLHQQSNTMALAGATALFGTFHQLLSSVVGPSLTERLMRSVWADASSSAAAKDLKT